MSLMRKRNALSLVDLCVRTAIDNVRYLGDVGETDIDLLSRILPHCTIDQLKHIEDCSKGRDLSPVTRKLWKRFYELEFGVESAKVVTERMKLKKLAYTWRELYQAKLKAMDDAQEKSFDRIKELYKKEDARKQSRQVQICAKVPPSSSKRSFWGGNGPSLTSSKSNIMKKAKLAYLNSPEVKNLATLKKNHPQKNHCVATVTKPAPVPRNASASTSKPSRPAERRW